MLPPKGRIADLVAKRSSAQSRHSQVWLNRTALQRDFNAAKSCGSLPLGKLKFYERILEARLRIAPSIVVGYLATTMFTSFGTLVGLVGADLLGFPRSSGILLFGTAAMGCGALLTLYPTSAKLKELAESNRRSWQEAEETASAIKREFYKTDQQIQSIRDELRQLSEAIQKIQDDFDNWQQNVAKLNTPLLRQDWENMRGVPFEEWLAKVFCNLGGIVKTTPTSGDQGVDLLVQINQLTLAVQAKGYPSNTVGNKAVQEAHTGARYYRATHAAVITNSTFTRQARELARGVGCILIDRSQVEDLAKARIERLRGKEPT